MMQHVSTSQLDSAAASSHALHSVLQSFVFGLIITTILWNDLNKPADVSVQFLEAYGNRVTPNSESHTNPYSALMGYIS